MVHYYTLKHFSSADSRDHEHAQQTYPGGAVCHYWCVELYSQCFVFSWMGQRAKLLFESYSSAGSKLSSNVALRSNLGVSLECFVSHIALFAGPSLLRYRRQERTERQKKPGTFRKKKKHLPLCALYIPEPCWKGSLLCWLIRLYCVVLEVTK